MPTVRKPTHPGDILRHDYLIPLGLTVTALAEHLGVSRKHLSRLINEQVPVSADMALRLSRAFNTTPELWLNLQRKCDLWEAAQQPGGWRDIEPIQERRPPQEI
ncbi:MAG: HigA family addiction module antitoxin [Desulfovibrionaceae bacterium]